MVRRRRHHAGIADEMLLRVLDRPSAEAVPLEGRDIAVELGVASRRGQRPAEIPGHLGIGIQRGEGFAVRLPPTPQRQAGGLAASSADRCRTGSGRCRRPAPSGTPNGFSAAALNSARAAALVAAGSAPSSSTTHSTSSALGWSMLLGLQGRVGDLEIVLEQPQRRPCPAWQWRAEGFRFSQSSSGACMAGSGTKRTVVSAPPSPCARSSLHAERKPPEVREARHHGLAPRRLVGEQREVARRRQVGDRVAFVGREVFGRGPHRDIAAGTMEARQVHPLVDMLAIVPLVEVALVARLHLVVHDQHSFAVQRHGFSLC